jgi:2-polyprenyl-6-methoxyphenol hydroxylase-like FAD-dependent oxidoreductase
MPAPRTAIVIGAGIGGLAAAIALQRAGLTVAVYERTPTLAPVGAGLSLWANAIRALDHLGLHDAVAAPDLPAAIFGIRTWRGELLVGATAEELAGWFGASGVVVHRADLHAALLQATGPVNVRLGMHCTGFEQDADGVTAFFADGSQARSDLLIGADGLHSIVRAQLHGAQGPLYAGYTAWRAVVAFDHARLQPGESWGAGRRFGHLPLRDGRVYWFAAATSPAGTHAPDGERAGLLAAYRGWHAPIEDLIAATDEAAILRNDIFYRRPLAAWGVGRVTLLGDAAHPMTPDLGQGACQALEDAVVLGRCLAADNNVVTALRAYEGLRLPRTNRLVRQSRMAGRVAQWQHPLAVGLRTLLLRRLGPVLLPRQLQQTAGYRL